MATPLQPTSGARAQRILVTGASGFVGRAICSAFDSVGIQVLRGSRLPMTAPRPGERWVAYGNIGADTDWSSALSGVDQVVHVAGMAHVPENAPAAIERLLYEVNVRGTERLARAAAAQGVRRFIFVSSALVHGSTSGAEPIEETHLLRPEGTYARSKVDAEGCVREVASRTAMELVILRPPLVYGAGAAGNFRRLVRVVRSGIPLPLGRATAPRSVIGIDNLADATVRCAIEPSAAGSTFLVADWENSSTADLIERIAAACGRRAKNFGASPAAMQRILVAIGRRRDFERLFSPFALNTMHVATKLSWWAPVPMAQGIQRAVSHQSTRWFDRRNQHV